MLDGYEEIWKMAKELGKPIRPLWWDMYGCPRWEEPKKELKRFIKLIACQYCSQKFAVCLVDDVYRQYSRERYQGIFFSGKLPKHWHYGDAPSHPPKKEMWDTQWWDGGWDTHCTGTTMTSIPEYEFEHWELKDGIPRYKEHFLAENEKEDGEK